MRVRVYYSRDNIAVLFHHTDEHVLGLHYDIAYDADSVLVLFGAKMARERMANAVFELKGRECPLDVQWPFRLEVMHSRRQDDRVPVFAPMELEGKLLDGDALQIDLPPIHERPWPQFQRRMPYCEEMATECLMERARSLISQGCREREPRSQLRLTSNALGAIPAEAWRGARALFNQGEA